MAKDRGSEPRVDDSPAHKKEIASKYLGNKPKLDDSPARKNVIMIRSSQKQTEF